MSETIDILMELLNEYRESGCAIEEDRVTYYADRLDGRTEDERTKTEQNGVGSSRFEQCPSITDELREYAEINECKSYCKLLNDIADRIDEQVSKMYANLTIGMEPMTDDSMAEHGWIRLPVDADGVPIRFNDKLDGYGQIHRVHQLRLYQGRDWSLVDEHGDVYYDMAGFTHVKPDSWEAIIKDAVSLGYADYPTTSYEAELVERCGRLADGI